jgi:hypothetical protein
MVFSHQNCKVSTRCRTHNIGLVNMGLVIPQRVGFIEKKMVTNKLWMRYTAWARNCCWMRLCYSHLDVEIFRNIIGFEHINALKRQ